MSDIRYQFLQVNNAYNNENQLLESYRVAGYIIFDRTRGTITVVKEGIKTMEDTTGYTEYGSGIKGASYSSTEESIIFTDNLGNKLKLDLKHFITESDLTSILDKYYTRTESSDLFASKVTFENEVSNLRDLETEVGTVKQDITGLKQEDVELDSRIDELENKISGLGNVFNFVGQVNTVDDLPSSADPGDVYQVAKGGTLTQANETLTFEDNTEFYWTDAGGQGRWEILGVNEINLEGYVKNGDVKLESNGREVKIVSGKVESGPYTIPYATEANVSAQANYAASADYASKASQDSDGNNIVSTYAKLSDLCWHTLN